MEVKRFEPALNAQCLCGSGKKFKRCCFGQHLGYGLKPQEKARELLRAGNYKEAMIFARQSITIYTILHKTNTAPYIKSKKKGVEWLLDVDIKALSELVSTLLDCYRGLGELDEFINASERLRGHINDIRWNRKITYYQVVASLGEKWSDSVGRKAIRKLLPVDNENDPEILQICLHFLPDNSPFTKKLELIDRIIGVVEKPAELLQYKVAKAVQYLLIGDSEKAISITEDALREYEETDWKYDDTYGKHKRAECLSLLADMKESGELKRNALFAYHSLLKEDAWTDAGLASLYLEIGKCHFHLGELTNAIEKYGLSLDKKDDELTKIFMAQAYCEKDIKEAVQLITRIDHSKLDPSGTLDFIFNYAAIAIESSDKELISSAASMLKEVRGIDPVFEARKSELLAEISDCLIQRNCKSKSGVVKRMATNLATFASRYLILQPNIAGLGININKIVEDTNKET